MDWAAVGTLGALLAGVGTLTGGLFTWIGKRGENRVNHSGTALTGYSTLTSSLQKERDRLERKVADRDATHAADQTELARLRKLVIDLGGEP
jgi:hypothetical protein